MIPAEDIMDLLKLCIALTYFHYNDNHYKQLHGTAMESPVSVVVAETVMQNIEKRGLYTCLQTIPLWLCYADEKFTDNESIMSGHAKTSYVIDYPGPCLNPWSTTTSGLESHNLKLKEISGILYLYSLLSIFFRRLS